MIKLNKNPLLTIALCGVFGLAGCQSAPTAANNSSNANTAVVANGNAANKPANSAVTNTAANAERASTGDAIGVAECDDFIQKYEACINSNVPESGRAAAKSSIDQWRASWKQLASNPQTKSTLAAACKNALESTRASTAAYNCKW